MGRHGVVGSWGDESATDGTRIKPGYGKGTVYKEARKTGSQEPTKRSLEPIWGVERELRRCGRESGRCGQRWSDRWANLGKSGQKVGKGTGFDHLATGFDRLGPDKSMQVVDFPHLSTVRVFWGGMESAFAERILVCFVRTGWGRNMGLSTLFSKTDRIHCGLRRQIVERAGCHILLFKRERHCP